MGFRSGGDELGLSSILAFPVEKSRTLRGGTDLASCVALPEGIGSLLGGLSVRRLAFLFRAWYL